MKQHTQHTFGILFLQVIMDLLALTHKFMHRKVNEVSKEPPSQRGIQADIGKEHAATFGNTHHPGLRADCALNDPYFPTQFAIS